jgi:hypothetical protein
MPTMYTVKDKDTLYGIANKLKVSPDVILKINPKFTSLKPGMVVSVPGTKGKSIIPKIPAVPKVTPGVPNRPPGAYNVPLPPPTITRLPASASGAYSGALNRITGQFGQQEAFDNFEKIRIGQGPGIIDRYQTELMNRIKPGTTIWLVKVGYVLNPITGNYVNMASRSSTGGMQTPEYAGVAPTAGNAGTVGSGGYTMTAMQQKTYENYLKYSGLTSLPASGDAEGWRKYYQWKNAVTSGGGADESFVGSTSAMGGLSQSGYNVKGAAFSKTPWADKYKKKNSTPPTSTSPKPQQNYSNNYVNYGVGLIHWRV